MQELMAMVPLAEVQSSRTQRPTAGSSYPYVDITVGDMNAQRVVQLQLEQVQTSHTSNVFHRPSQQTCVVSSAEPGAVSSYCHAGGEHDVCARKKAHSATQWNHCVVAHSHTLPNNKSVSALTHTLPDVWTPGDHQVSSPFTLESPDQKLWIWVFHNIFLLSLSCTLSDSTNVVN